VRGHADAATLAAFREELLSRRKAARVSAHLAACPRCAALDAQLAEVTTMLHRATAPPMPDALTARIQAALATEAAARAVDAPPLAAAAAGAGAATPGTPGRGGSQRPAGQDRAREQTGRRAGWRGHDRSWLALRVAAVTAAVAVTAGGSYGVAQLLTGSPAVNGTASGAGAPGPNIRVTGPVPRMSGGFGTVPGSSNAPGTGGSAHRSASTLAPLVLSSGTNYQPASLGAQASSVLKQLTRSAHSSARPVPTLAPSHNQASLFPDLRSCLIHIANGQHPLLVDLAKYQGHPALIVVLPSTNGGQPRALVVAPGCTATTAHIVATAPLPRSG
jgi:hypothetical protein